MASDLLGQSEFGTVSFLSYNIYSLSFGFTTLNLARDISLGNFNIDQKNVEYWTNFNIACMCEMLSNSLHLISCTYSYELV